MADTIIDFEIDKLADKPSGDLAQVSDMAQRVLAIQIEIKQLDEQKAKKKAELDRLLGADLPDLMDSLQLSEITLPNGHKVAVKSVIKASLPTSTAIARAQDKGALEHRLIHGLEWLRRHGAASIIKNKVIADLGKDSSEDAASLLEAAKDLGLEARQEQVVHPMTLSAYIREKLEAGEEVPFETFSVYSGRVATISPPR